MEAVAELREFNRFYTQEIGLLNPHLPESHFSLAEGRVIYELAKESERTAAELGRRLAMDKAHLSRILARFRMRGLVMSRPSPMHGKHRLLSLTAAGRDAFAALDRGSQGQIEAKLAPLDAEARSRLLRGIREIRSALGGAGSGSEVKLRGLEAGDLGWIIHRQGVLYHREYGWDWTFEGLAAEILGRFAAAYDPAREAGWIAHQEGSVVGSVFLMKTEHPEIGRLRLLYVEPGARGLGIGSRLVSACIERARQVGYAELTLWTNDVLVSARRLYERAGFRLIEEAPHHSFGHDLIGQTWTLELR